VLTHIKIQDGYTLDYIYYCNGSLGEPRLYIRPVSMEAFTGYSEFYDALDEAQQSGDDPNKLPVSLADAGSKIIIDGTKEGFFEYTVLQVLGGQFYLFWHGGYNDTRIICSPEKLNEVIVERQNTDFGLQMPSNAVKKAKTLDYNPIIEFNDTAVTVSLLTFTKWGGFQRTIYTFNRESPCILIETKEETLVEYQCGVTF
jgi:hypothetical protein